jgi:hypothetical protein
VVLMKNRHHSLRECSLFKMTILNIIRCENAHYLKFGLADDARKSHDNLILHIT